MKEQPCLYISYVGLPNTENEDKSWPSSGVGTKEKLIESSTEGETKGKIAPFETALLIPLRAKEPKSSRVR